MIIKKTKTIKNKKKMTLTNKKKLTHACTIKRHPLDIFKISQWSYLITK